MRKWALACVLTYSSSLSINMLLQDLSLLVCNRIQFRRKAAASSRCITAPWRTRCRWFSTVALGPLVFLAAQAKPFIVLTSALAGNNAREAPERTTHGSCPSTPVGLKAIPTTPH